MKTLIVSKEGFGEMLLDLIKSGVTFEAEEKGNGTIVVTFTGGF